ncbi:MAG: signal peptidase I [Bacillota bacterium]
MYLFLVDYNFISSEQLQKMIGQILPGADIVNCFSTDTLLKITEKLMPDIIIIDYDLVKEDQAGLIENLRIKSKGAHILALIDPDYYEKLYSAIEIGAVDDYMVKPIRKEDFMARIYIATRRKGLAVEDIPKAVSYSADQESISTGYDLKEDMESEEIFDEDVFARQVESAMETEPRSDQENLFDEDDLYEEDETGMDEVVDYRSPYEEEIHEDLSPEPETEKIGSEEESREFDEEGLIFEKEEPVTEASLEPQEELDLFEKGFSEPEQKPGEEAEEVDQDEGLDYFAYETGSEKKPDQESAAEAEIPALDLFDQSPAAGPERDEFTRLFSSEPDERKPVSESEGLNEFEDLTSDEIEEIKDDDLKPEEDVKPAPEKGPAHVKPAAEFLGKDVDTPRKLSETVTDSQPTEDKYFDELFSTKPSSADLSSDIELETDAGEKDTESNLPEHAEEKRREFIKRRSDLPGESADEFLYGESENQEEDAFETPFDEFIKNDQDTTGVTSRSEKKKSTKRGLRRFFSLFGNFVFVVLLLMMATLSFFLIQSRVTGGVPQVAGYQMYIVLSGSMAPEFDTGSLAFVREVEPEEVTGGDIITYRSQAGSDSLTTHRVIQVQSNETISFITRGDSNNFNDPNPVPAENVVGRVTGSVPYVGYLLNYVQTREGLILLIFVPGVLIIVYELSKIIRYMSQGEKGKGKSKGEKHSALAEE